MLQLLKDRTTALVDESAVAERLLHMNPLLFDKSIKMNASDYSVENAIAALT